MRIIDLTVSVRPHARWRAELGKRTAHARGDISEETTINIGGHGFTHIDAPRHFFEEARIMEDVPLDWLVGMAAVLDLSHKGDEEQITPEDLNAAAGNLDGEKIVLLRTDHDLRHSSESREFWASPPFLTPEAAKWLSQQDVKTVGWDFPGDYILRFMGQRPLTKKEFYTHTTLLGNDMINVEYLTNLHKISQPRVFVAILPLKVLGSHDGAPCRAIAIEDFGARV